VDSVKTTKTHPSHHEQSTKTTYTRAHNLQPDAYMVSNKHKAGPSVQVIDSPDIAHVESTIEVTIFHTSNIAEPKNLSVLDKESEPVSLHNSFDILNTDDDVSYEEALGPDLNPHDSSARQMTVNQNELVSGPLEHASVSTYTSLKAPLSIETRPSNNVLLNHTQLDKEGSGRQSFPCPPSPSNLQSNLAGRLSFPTVTSTFT